MNGLNINDSKTQDEGHQGCVVMKLFMGFILFNYPHFFIYIYLYIYII